jgi:adiponectin receptor
VSCFWSPFSKSFFRQQLIQWFCRTHLIAAIITLVLCVVAAVTTQQSDERAALTVFFVGCIAVYTLSFVFHTLFVCSYRMLKVLARFDYLGIVLGIFGCLFSVVLLGYPCGIERIVHIVIVIALAVACVVILLYPSFDQPKFRTFRTVVFAVFGCYGVVPLVRYGYVQFSNPLCWNNPQSAPSRNLEEFSPVCASILQRLTLQVIGLGVSFLGGAALYAARIPERWWPGKFDIIGHSHQIWHCAIIAGFTFHFYALETLRVHRRFLAPHCFA